MVPIISARVSWLILRDDRNGLRILAKVGHQHQQPGEALFAGIEQMIDQISFHADVAGEHVREELLGKLRLTMEQVQHGSLFDANDGAGLKRDCGGNAKRLACQGAFTEEAGLWKVGDYGFFAAHRCDGKLHLATLNVEHCIGRIALRKNGFAGQVFAPLFSGQELGRAESECRTRNPAPAEPNRLRRNQSTCDAQLAAEERRNPVEPWLPYSLYWRS